MLDNQSVAPSPSDLAKTYASIDHRTHLIADLELLTRAAREKGIDGEVLDFIDTYARRAALLAKRDLDLVIGDRLEAEERAVDPKEIEIAFQARQASRTQFHAYVQENLARFMKNEAQFNQLVAFYALVANNNDRTINSLVRENVFDTGRPERDIARVAYDPNDPRARRIPINGGVPGGLERMTRPHARRKSDKHIIHYDESIEALDQVISDVGQVAYRETITAHPTELATARAVKLFADMYDAKRELLAAPEDKKAYFAQRLYDIALQMVDPNFSLIKLDDQGHIENFTPIDEVENAELPLMQKVRGLEETYGTYWRFMQAEWGDKFDANRKLRFTLDYQLATWVTDDIDGNKNKKSEHSLYGMVRNTSAILAHYNQRLVELREAGGMTPELSYWEARFETAGAQLRAFEADILAKKKGKDLVMTQKEYAAALDTFEGILGGVGDGEASVQEVTRRFQQDLVAAYKDAKDPAIGEKALLLSKTVKSFGFHLAKNEYRQTSDEHTKIVDYLLQFEVDGKSYPGYAKLNTYQRKQFLNKHMLADKDFLKKRIDAFLADVGEDGSELRDVDDVRALTLHTVRMMQKAGRFGHAHERMVLAEYGCTAHYLEAVAISEACGAKLHVSPLLEDMDTLQKYKEFFYDIVTTPAILRHVYNVSGRSIAKLAQFWQAAYSDNVKRYGIGTRTFIEGMWRSFPDFITQTISARSTEIAAALKAAGVPFNSIRDFAVQLFPYHGKSHLHPDRDGGRSLTAGMRDYTGYFIRSLNKIYYDLTVQGGDNSRKYHVVDAIKRNLARIFSEGAIMIAQERGGVLNGHGLFSDEFANGIAATIQLSQNRFRNNYFSEDSPQGETLAHPIVGDMLQKTVGNGSSRAAVRKQNDGGKRNIYARGVDGSITKAVAPGDMRAITRVEDEVNAGSRLSALGIYGMETDLNRFFKTNPKFLVELQKVLLRSGKHALDNNGNLSIYALQALRDGLPSFKKHTDEIVNALRCSDLEFYDRRLTQARDVHGVPITKGVAKDLENRQRDYLQGSQVIMKCFGLDPAQFDKAGDAMGIRIERMRYILARFAMPNSVTEISNAQEFDALGMFARDAEAIQLWKDGEAVGNNMGDAIPTPPQSRRLRLYALSRLSFSHGNMPTMQDTLHGQDLLRRQVVEAAKLAA